MAVLVADAVDATLKYIGQVAGPGVQTYGEDRIFDGVVRGFDLLFKKRFWEHYSKWYRFQLDGTLGVISSATGFQKVRDFEDFRAVFRDGTVKELGRMPNVYNPFAITSTSDRLVGWTSLHVSDANYDGRKLQFYPVLSEEYVNVYAREYPLDAIAQDWDDEDTMYFDKHLLTYAAAVEILAGDDLNSSAAAIAQGAMESKYKDIIGSLNDHPIPVRGGRGPVPDQWYVTGP